MNVNDMARQLTRQQLGLPSQQRKLGANRMGTRLFLCLCCKLLAVKIAAAASERYAYRWLGRLGRLHPHQQRPDCEVLIAYDILAPLRGALVTTARINAMS